MSSGTPGTWSTACTKLLSISGITRDSQLKSSDTGLGVHQGKICLLQSCGPPHLHFLLAKTLSGSPDRELTVQKQDCNESFPRVFKHHGLEPAGPDQILLT